MEALTAYKFRRFFKTPLYCANIQKSDGKIGQGVQTKQMIRMCIMQLD